MDRSGVLRTAEQYVCHDRQNKYGGMEDNFERIAAFWSVYLGIPVEAKDVPAMMGLLKLARICTGCANEDSWIDLAGYAACGGELATKNDSQ